MDGCVEAFIGRCQPVSRRAQRPDLVPALVMRPHPTPTPPHPNSRRLVVLQETAFGADRQRKVSPVIPWSYAYIRQHCSYLFTQEKGGWKKEKKRHHICLTHLPICVHHVRNAENFLQLSDHFTLANFSLGVADKQLPAGPRVDSRRCGSLTLF